MINVDPLKETNISYLSVLADEIDMQPNYQRDGDIWSRSKKQLFIDSLLNGMDIPKLYFHELKKSRANNLQYAVVDGKQRLETVFEFLTDTFPLSDEFKDYSGEFNELAGKFYSEFSSVSPKVKARFDAKQLPIYVIRTDDEDLIEEMFYRLNEAAPLNAAEKRNSTSPPFSKMTKAISQHAFFERSVAFSSRRFRHLDVIAKLLLINHSEQIVDTKKIHLDSFARSLRDFTRPRLTRLSQSLTLVLDDWVTIFSNKDPLLKSPASLPVLLIVYKYLQEQGELERFDVSILREFESERFDNRQRASYEDPDEDINFKWLEYDRLMQSSNDSSSIRFRAIEMLSYLGCEDAEAIIL